jgi:uncharacterized protein (DUF433 family)
MSPRARGDRRSSGSAMAGFSCILHCPQALTYDPADPNLRYALGLAFGKKGQQEGSLETLAAAKKHFRAMLNTNAEMDEARSRRRILLPSIWSWRRGRVDDMHEMRRITVDPAVMGGKPCIRGMRVTVGMVLESLAAGRTTNELLADFPYLEEQDIREALMYGAMVARRVPQPAP